MDEFRQRVRECEICGGPMVKKGARAKYCSRECYGKSKTLKALERSPAKECVLCGKEFRSKDPGAIFCGRKCYVASLRGGEDKECAYCGEVMPWNSPWECCSVQCAGLLRRVRNEKRSSTCLQCGKFILMKTAQSKFCSPSPYFSNSVATLAGHALRQPRVRHQQGNQGHVAGPPAESNQLAASHHPPPAGLGLAAFHDHGRAGLHHSEFPCVST